MLIYCARTLDDGSICGGRLSTPIKGRQTGRWFQTCVRCRETRSTPPPPELSDRPIAYTRPPGPLPLTWQQRLEDDER